LKGKEGDEQVWNNVEAAGQELMLAMGVAF
jgi:hypothetical protein